MITKILRSRRRRRMLSPEIEDLHRTAVANGQETYIDPVTGYMVFTALSHQNRGKCCGKGCRHCPYGHFNVKEAQQRWAPLPTKPTLLQLDEGAKKVPSAIVDVLFWSGGKDSFLAYHRLANNTTNDIVLLTTFDSSTGIVPEQEVEVTKIMDQAKYLIQRDLLIVPLISSPDSFKVQVMDALAIITSVKGGPKQLRLTFGDLHLADLKAYREKTFSPYNCVFPLFQVDYKTLYSELFKTLRANNARLFFSAINDPKIKYRVGDEITEIVMQTMLNQNEYDAFGENGEYHTFVSPPITQ